jgi:hypothetical protein
VLNKFFKKENCVDDKNNFQAQVLRDVHFRDSGAHSLSCNSREEVKEETLTWVHVASFHLLSLLPALSFVMLTRLARVLFPKMQSLSSLSLVYKPFSDFPSTLK